MASLLLPLLLGTAVALTTPPYVQFEPAGVWPGTSYVTTNASAPRLASTRLGPTAPGLLFLAPFGPGTTAGAPTILREDGTLVWQGAPGAPGETFMTPDVTAPLFAGRRPHLLYWAGDVDAGNGIGYGAVRILDEGYGEVAALCGDEGLGDVVFSDGRAHACVFDFHETLATADGGLLATVYNVTSADLRAVGGPERGWVIDTLVVELDIATQAVRRRWSPFEHRHALPLTASRWSLNATGELKGETPTTAWDYMHVNSIDKLGDGYLVSSRHYCEVFFVNAEGDVEWRLNVSFSSSQEPYKRGNSTDHYQGETGGSFRLADDAHFCFQHHAQGTLVSATELHLYLFDNGDGTPGGEFIDSAGLLLSLDLAKREAKLVRRLRDPWVRVNSWHTGSAQPLAGTGGGVLVNYGQPPVLQEFDARGDLVWTAAFGTADGVTSYRAFKREWHATPAAPPTVVTRPAPGGRGVDVYVSWNGATDVAQWRFWIGAAAETLEKVAEVDNTGFEVRAELDFVDGFVQVEALDHDGKSLGMSGVTTITAGSSVEF